MKAKELLAQLNLDDYEKIFHALGVQEIRKTDSYWIVPTLCHNLDISSASYKLYFYLDTKTTFCFTECQKTRDIIALVSDRWRLEGKQDFTFLQVLEWICGVCGINGAEKVGSQGFTQPAWKSRLSVYNVDKKSHYLGKRYDKSILRFLSPYHSPVFLNDGISESTMEKFGIGFYAPNNQITIPVYDLDGELIGIHCRNLNQKELDKGKKYIPLRTVSGLDYRFKTNEVLYGMNMNYPVIEQRKQIQLFESPKAVLQLDSMYDTPSTAVGMFGLNLGKNRRSMIIEAGVSEVIIGIDKDYETEDSKEFDKFISSAKKIARLFKGYARCSVLYDKDNLLANKNSPTDCGREVYEKLMADRMVVEG